jgi:hypothetical protein
MTRVVDVSNSASFEDVAVMKFFEASTRNLLAQEAAAGVRLCSLELLGGTLPGQSPQCGQGQRRPDYSRQPLAASHLDPVCVGSSI